MEYTFLERESIDGVARLGADSYKTRIDVTSLTDRMLMDYVLWDHFYKENMWKIIEKRQVQRIEVPLILYVSELCASYYGRNKDEFIQNVQKVQDIVDVSYRRGVAAKGF